MSEGRVMARFAGRLGSFLAAALMAASLVAGAAQAVEPDEILKDPALEARARQLSLELRCLVCQNQSIDDSNAPLARDLRVVVRERLQAGDSDKQVLDFVVSRYGEFVLLRPPFNARTLLLWLAPALALIVALWLAYRVFAAARSNRTVAAGPAPSQKLTADEEARLKRILDDN